MSWNNNNNFDPFAPAASNDDPFANLAAPTLLNSSNQNAPFDPFGDVSLTPQSSTKGLGMVNFDFTGTESNQITIMEGQTIEIVEQGDAGGWSQATDLTGNVKCICNVM
jgi:hypothetical protein